MRGIGNGENLDKIVTFVLGGQRWLERIRSCGDGGGLGQVQLEAAVGWGSTGDVWCWVLAWTLQDRSATAG